MKKLIYKYENMKQMADLLEQVQVTGTQNFRLLAAIADLLDSGELSEETEAGTLTYKHGTPPVDTNKQDQIKKEDNKDGMEYKEIRKDKLEK